MLVEIIRSFTAPLTLSARFRKNCPISVDKLHHCTKNHMAGAVQGRKGIGNAVEVRDESLPSLHLFQRLKMGSMTRHSLALSYEYSIE